jgi:hypothetical protein
VNGELTGAEVYASSALLKRLWPKLLKSAATEALAEADEKKKFEPPTAKAIETAMAEATAEPAKELNLVANDRGNAVQAVNAPATQNDVGQSQAGAQTYRGQQPSPGQSGTPAQTSARVRIVRYDSKRLTCVECQDKEQPGLVIHRSYFSK